MSHGRLLRVVLSAMLVSPALTWAEEITDLDRYDLPNLVPVTPLPVAPTVLPTVPNDAAEERTLPPLSGFPPAAPAAIPGTNPPTISDASAYSAPDATAASATPTNRPSGPGLAPAGGLLPNLTVGDAELQRAMETYGRDIYGGVATPPGVTKPAAPPKPVTTAPLGPCEVIASLEQLFPLLTIAELELAVRDGLVISALGAFDLRLDASSEHEALGFYRTHRHAVGVAQPLAATGGEVGAGYRIGRGFFADWYGFRQTDDGGEFSATIKQPFLQGKAIDERRATLTIAQLDRARAEPLLKQARLIFSFDALAAYWNWVAAGHTVRVARQLVEASDRNLDAVKTEARLGAAGGIPVLDRQRALALRQAKLADAELKYRAAAQKLALFLRNEQGEPIEVADGRLPAWFPEPRLPQAASFEEILGTAFAARPELIEVDLKIRQAHVELELAQNKQLPKLDGYLKVSQDMGLESTKKNDKGDFSLDAALEFSVPYQRREAQGKEQAVRNKIAQLHRERQFKADKITNELRYALAQLIAIYREIQETQIAYQQSRDVEEKEQIRFFRLGEGDIFTVIAREQATADTATLLIAELADYFTALAAYQAAIGQTDLCPAP